MITKDTITEIFCIIDEFTKNLDKELEKNLHLEAEGECIRHRNRKGMMSDSEIIYILVCYHFVTFRNFRHYYLFFIKNHMRSYFPRAVSYNRFVEMMPRMFFQIILFMKLQAFGRCNGISFVDSTMILVCHITTRFSGVLPLTIREPWAGVTNSSCICCAMTAEKS